MSPIPLGILAAAGITPGATGSFDLLQTTILTGNQTQVDFTNLISSYGSTYQHLQLRVTMRGSQSQQWELLGIRFNNVTSGGSYKSHQLIAALGGLFSQEIGATDKFEFEGFQGATAGSGVFGAGVIDILDPFETNKNKTVRARTARLVDANTSLSAGLFVSTNAVNTITIFARSQMVAGSRFSLYGLKASA